MTEETASMNADKKSLGIDSGRDPSGQPVAGHGAATRHEVVIHARFHPNGLVNTINHRPEHFDPQGWFDHLCLAAPTTYQPLAGGRGAFRIRGDVFDRLWREATAG